MKRNTKIPGSKGRRGRKTRAETLRTAEELRARAQEAPEDSAGHLPPSETVLGEAAHAEDALGLYLQQMGSIPLLNRSQESELAQRLDRARQRFRHAALCDWAAITHVLDTF